MEAQRALDSHLPIAEGFIGEDFRLWRFLESEEGIADALDVLGGEFAVLLAHVLAQGLEPLGGVDELHLAFAMLGLPVREHPDVSGDAGVVEEVQREGDDGLQPIVLDDPAADVALTLAGVACEEGGAVVHLGNAAAERGVVLHLAEHVGQKEHLAIATPSDERVFGVAGVLDQEARIFDILFGAFAAHALQVGFPALAVGRIGEHEVERAGAELVVRQGGEGSAADDVVRFVAVAFEQEVGLADGVRFGVDLLSVQVGGDLFAVGGCELLEGFLCNRQHAAGAARAIVEQVGAGLDLVGHGKEHEVGHEPDGVAGCPVFTGFLVVLLVEAADEFLEDRAHGVVVEPGQFARGAGTEVDVLVEELLDELAEAVGFGELGDLVSEFEVLEDFLHVRREPIQVDHKIVLERLLRLAGLEIGQKKGRGVVEGLTGGGAQGIVLIGDPLLVEGRLHFHYGLLRRLQDGVETAENGHRQDHVSVFSPDEDIAKDIVGNRPDETHNASKHSFVHICIRIRHSIGGEAPPQTQVQLSTH